MTHEIAGGDDRHQQEADDDRPCIAARYIHGPRDCGDRDAIVIFSHGIVAGRLYCVCISNGSMHSANVSKARADVQPWQHLRTLYELNERLAENTTRISPGATYAFLS